MLPYIQGVKRDSTVSLVCFSEELLPVTKDLVANLIHTV